VRQAEILATARNRGVVGIAELAEAFGVSVPTIRRDLTELAGRGLLNRVYGGATDRSRLALLAAAAAELVGPGAAVGLSTGAVATEIAALLRTVPAVTVVTPSLAVAAQLPSTEEQVVVVVGGVRTAAGGHAGRLAVDTIRQVNLDVAFVCVDGISLSGYGVREPLTAETDRALFASAACRVAVAEPGTWGAVGTWTVAPLDGVDVLVAADLPAEARALVTARVRRVVAV
jgi:DeoR/GlpR family transcriptional regulator of sugar metabolism